MTVPTKLVTDKTMWLAELAIHTARARYGRGDHGAAADALAEARKHIEAASVRLAEEASE